MVKLECILRAEKLEPVKDALNSFGVKGLTVSQVMGCGLQKGRTEVYRGTEISINLLPKVKLEIVTVESRLDELVKLISETARTGTIGDGKIFVIPVQNTIRVRTGEDGEKALL